MLSGSADSTHTAHWWSSPHLPGVEIKHCSHFGGIPAFQLIPMVQIAATVEGGAEMSWAGDVWQETPGGCVVSAPNCNFRVLRLLSERGSMLRAYIEPRVFDEWMQRHLKQVTSFQLRHLLDTSLADALRGLAAKMMEERGPSELRQAFDSIMERVDRFLSGSAENNATQRPEVRKAVRMLQDRFAECVPLEELAAAVGLSKFHLIRLFRKQVGFSPHAFQLQLRISRARQMLADGTTLADVADACGFADQAHFSRCFKNAVGYTPGTFQRLG